MTKINQKREALTKLRNLLFEARTEEIKLLGEIKSLKRITEDAIEINRLVDMINERETNLPPKLEQLANVRSNIEKYIETYKHELIYGQKVYLKTAKWSDIFLLTKTNGKYNIKLDSITRLN